MHDEALVHLRRRNVRPAQAILRQLQEHDAGSVHCLLLEGHCALIGQGDRASASSLYERALRKAGKSDDDRCDALHALARLLRMEERWDDADELYSQARKLRPHCTDLSQEGRFARAKRLLVSNQPADAAVELEAGLETAAAEWRPHFAREIAHARALAGDAVESVVRGYEEALRLGGLPDEMALGETLSTLAAHAEAEGRELERAARLLQRARAAFSSHGSAKAAFRLGQTLEALRALGEEPTEPIGCKGSDEHPAEERAALPASRLPGSEAAQEEAAEAYAKAIALQPTMAEAYEALGRLRLGVSKLTNFGARHAAGLHTDEAEQLLRTAQALREESTATAGSAQLAAAALGVADSEGVAAAAAEDSVDDLLAAIDESRREVESWADVAASLQADQPAAATDDEAEGAAAAEAAAEAAARDCDDGDGTDAAGGTSHGRGQWRPAALFSTAEELPRVDAADAEALWRHVSAGEPVVIRNLQQLAGFAPRAAWSRAGLSRALGSHVVRVSVSQDGRFDGPEDGALWGVERGNDVLVRPPETHMRLADLLTLLRAPTAEAFYCEYNAMHQYGGAALQAMAPLPPHPRAMRPLLANLWLGKGATTSPLHYDDYENLLSQVHGTKRLLLFPPADLPYLYYTPRVKGTLRYAWPNNFSREIAPAAADGAHKVIFGSSVNISSPDLRRHPLLPRASPRKCTLREGETLLLPSFWHHEVHSEAACAGDVNVAVNHWFRNLSAPPPGLGF